MSVCFGQDSNLGHQSENTALPSARAGQHFVGAQFWRTKAPFWRTAASSGSTSSAPWHNSGAPIFSALPTKPAPRRTTHQILPCPPQGQGSLLEAIVFRPKIELKIQFNSFLHQIKSPSKSQNPRIESV